jgi:hypothetical protein
MKELLTAMLSACVFYIIFVAILAACVMGGVWIAIEAGL